MSKLNKKKIRWIIKQKAEGTLTNREIAFPEKISVRRINQIYAEYKRTGIMPALRKQGRKPKPLSEEHKKIVDEAHKEYKVGPLGLEKVIQRWYKLHIPHNTIYKYMLIYGKVIENPKKKKQRKWVRYERPHSLALVHTDWCEHNGTHMIAYIDDASRVLSSCMEFDNETTETSIIALDKAIEFASPYGGILQLMSDHGTQFTASKKDKNDEAEHRFEQYLASKGIEPVHARVKHPQSNGKAEKFVDTYKKNRDKFDTLDAFVSWYNNKRPHMSLNFNKAETPSEAFIRKMRSEVWFGFAKDWF
ncbi:MAG: DDE-type integrase/transposase/recombinase [archaeon]